MRWNFSYSTHPTTVRLSKNDRTLLSTVLCPNLMATMSLMWTESREDWREWKLTCSSQCSLTYFCIVPSAYWARPSAGCADPSSTRTCGTWADLASRTSAMDTALAWRSTHAPTLRRSHDSYCLSCPILARKEDVVEDGTKLNSLFQIGIYMESEDDCLRLFLDLRSTQLTQSTQFA